MRPRVTTPINLLLVDDHTLLRQGLKQLLAIDPHIVVVGEAENGEEAILKAITLKPHAILMDINMPKVNGYEASQAILTAWHDAKILILTNQDDAHVVKKFTDLNIMGFLLKDVEVDTLIDAVYHAVAGQKVPISEELREKMEAVKTISSGQAGLTEREQEVLRALAKGRSNQELADLLCVSPKTVNNHLYNIYSKIGAANRSEAIVWAIDNGFKG